MDLAANHESDPRPEINKIQEQDIFVIVNEIAQKLQAIGFNPDDYRREDRGRLPREAYEVIRSVIDSYDVSVVSFDKNVTIYLLKDSLGDILRRPIYGAAHRDYLELHFPDEDGTLLHVRNAINFSYEFQQYYDFDVKLENPFTVPVSERVKDLVHVCDVLHTFGESMRAHMEELFTMYDRDSWYCDPGHGASIPLEAAEMKMSLVYGKDPEGLFKCKLSRPVSFALIDDEKTYHWNLLFCSSRGFEAQKEDYHSGELFIEDMQSTDEFPEVIMIDIQLGEDKLNGLEVAAQVRQLSAERGFSPLIYCYSAAIPLYKEGLDELVNANVIQGYFSKPGLTTKVVVDCINADLTCRDLSEK